MLAPRAVVVGGQLHHSRWTLPQKIPVPVIIHITDTLYVEKQQQAEIQTVEVERIFTLWERFRLWAFWPTRRCVGKL